MPSQVGCGFRGNGSNTVMLNGLHRVDVNVSHQTIRRDRHLGPATRQWMENDGLVDLRSACRCTCIPLPYSCMCLGTGVKVWQVKRPCAKIDLEFNIRGDLHVAF
jgi:hypothetical protein